jgi:hypothetical protein
MEPECDGHRLRTGRDDDGADPERGGAERRLEPDLVRARERCARAGRRLGGEATTRQARGSVPWIGSPCSSTGTIARAPRRSTVRPSAS